MHLDRSFAPWARLAGAAFALCAVTSGFAASDPRTADRVTLKRLSDAWDQAIIRKDRAAIADNMSEDFRHIGSSGQISDKKTFVDDLMAPDVRIDPYTVEDFEIRLYGDVALLSGGTRMTGSEAGKPFTTHYRYIDVYVKRQGKWRVASVQISRMPS